MLWWAVFSIITHNVVCEEAEWLEVHTTQGPIRGRKDPEGGVFAFRGIPYATTPKGRDRFKAPLPPPTWDEPFEAINGNIICIQHPLLDISTKLMQEDCLIANVYVPDTKEKNLPVYVYIHGGAFEVGYGEMFTPKHLVRSKNIIVVTFNYRLGVHGFLCLGTEGIPGNAAMKDQVALLKWVNRNIASFGGNPEDVTIGGCSAGSVSAELLMLSKSTDGLFSKVILESGTCVAFIAIQKDPIANTKLYAQLTGFSDVDNLENLEEYFKTTPLESMTKTTAILKSGAVLLTPCIERHKDNDIFLDDAPINIIKQGKYKKLPILIGVSEMEGLPLIHHFDDWIDGMNANFIDFLPLDLKFDNDELEENALKIKQFYFKNDVITQKDVLGFVDYYSDVLFICSTLRAVKLHVQNGHNKIYLYEFSFVDEDTKVVPYTKVRGATHCAQTTTVLDGGGSLKNNESELTEAHKKMKEIMREIWANFVKYGKPVPEGSSLPPWPPANGVKTPYMSLNLPLQLRSALLPERTRFWDNLYEKYYDGPSAPVSSVKHTEL